MRSLFRRTTSHDEHGANSAASPPATTGGAQFHTHNTADNKPVSKHPKLSFSTPSALRKASTSAPSTATSKAGHPHHHSHQHHGSPIMVKKSVVSSFVEEDVPDDDDDDQAREGEPQHQQSSTTSNNFLNVIKERVVSVRNKTTTFPEDASAFVTALPAATSGLVSSALKSPLGYYHHKKSSSLDFEHVHVNDEDILSDDDDDEDEDEEDDQPKPTLFPRSAATIKASAITSRSRSDDDDDEDKDDNTSGDDDDDDHQDVVKANKRKTKNVRGMLAIRKSSGRSSNTSFNNGSSGDEDGSDLDSEGGGNGNDDDVLEDLFDDTLEEIRQQEALEQQQQLAAAIKKAPLRASTSSSRLLDFTQVLRQVPFFAQFSAGHQAQLFSVLEAESFRDGDSIVKQGDVGDKFYTIVDGEAVVSKLNKDTGEEKDLTHIYPGDFFGEMVLIYGGERVASVTSVGNTTCMTLSRKSFEQYPIIRYFLILQKVPLLSACSKSVQLEIVSRLKPVVFNAGEYVVKQGDHGDAFFMITKGSASVIEDDVKLITNLYEGHSFGEMSLLSDEPRVASVKATSELHLMLLSVKDFKELLTGEEDFSQLLEQESRKIRDLRDKREGKKQQQLLQQQQQQQQQRKSLAVVIDPPGALQHQPKQSMDSPVTPQLLPLGGKTPGKQQAAQLQQPSIAQQKLRLGKTAQGKRTVNQYVLLDEIGRGAFGVVKLCEHIDSSGNGGGAKFAIKIVDKAQVKHSNRIASKHQTTLEDIRREAAIMKDLHHPNIVELVDAIDDPKADQLYLVLEYCSGGAIMDNLEGSQPLAEPLARRYFRDLLSGIDYLHAHYIVHRDIKPMNLFISDLGQVKIGDFGSARVFKHHQATGWSADGGNASSQQPILLNIAGTPAFMAPELLGQESSLYDGPPVDLWSCGATLYMLMTGVPPWMADDEPTLARRVQNDELVFGQNKLSPHLKNILSRLLVKDPKGRMDLAQTMAHEWVTEEGSDPLLRFSSYGYDRKISHAAAHQTTAPVSSSSAFPSMASLVGSYNDDTGAVSTTPVGTPAMSARKLHHQQQLESPTAASAQQQQRGIVSAGSRKLSLANFSLFSSMRKDSATHVLSVGEDDVLFQQQQQQQGGGREREDSTTDFSLFDVGKSHSGMPLSNMVVDRPLSMFFGRNVGSHSASKKKAGGAGGGGNSIRSQFNRLSLAAPLAAMSSHTSGVFSSAALGGGGTSSRRQSFARESEHEAVGDADGGEEDGEMSLSAILNDPSMFKAMKRAKEFDNDKTLLPLPPTKSPAMVVRATRGNLVAHCAVRYGFAEAQGQRLGMEDCVAIVPKLPAPDTFFAAIFDGHGGDLVAKELKAKFHKVLGGLAEFSAEYSQNAASMLAFNTAVSSSPSPAPAQTLTTKASTNSTVAAAAESGGGGGGSRLLHHNSSAASMDQSTGSAGGAAAAAPDSSVVSAVSSTPPPPPSNAFGDSLALPSALRKACLKLDRNIMHTFASKLLDMETKIETGDEKKGLFRTKGAHNTLKPGGASGDADQYRKAGSTAVVALVRGGSHPKKQPGVLTVAWVGDSRAVLCRAGKPVEISKDHKAEREDEKARIRAHGGKVDRQGRLYGDLAVSRAFGDLQHKGRELRHIVSNTDENWGAEGTLIALPDVAQLVLTAQDEFLILASDGVWDVMTNEQVCNYVRFHLNRHGDVRKAALELVDKALEMHSVDNVSAVIIGFVGKY